MGDPRRLRKKFKRPRVPFEKARIDSELKYLGDYGLRNKREFWRAKSKLSKFRQIARDLKTMPEENQKVAFRELTTPLRSLGLVSSEATTDDVLSLSVENILDRRLQTIVYKKGFASTIYQARQLVTHKHIAIRDRVVNSPSYLVKVEEEPLLGYHTASPYSGRKEKLFGEKSAIDAETPKEAQAPRKRTRKRPSKESDED